MKILLPRKPPSRSSCRYSNGVTVDYEPAVSGNLRLLHRLLRGFAMLSKTQFPDVQILQYAFSGRLLVRWRVLQVVHYLTVWRNSCHAGELYSDGDFQRPAFLTLPTDGQGGSFMAFFAVFWRCS